MTERTRRYSIVMHFPFDPGGDYGIQPAGTYDVETIEEQLDSISTIAYRRLSTIIAKRPAPEDRTRPNSMMVEPSDLEHALERDRRAALAAHSKDD
jgi:hypothetical protein